MGHLRLQMLHLLHQCEDKQFNQVSCYLNFCNCTQHAMHILKLCINVLTKKDNLTGRFWYYTSWVLPSFKYHSLMFTIRHAEDIYFLSSYRIPLASRIQNLHKSTTVPGILLLTLSHGMVVIYFTLHLLQLKVEISSSGRKFCLLFFLLSLGFCISSDLIALRGWDLC